MGVAITAADTTNGTWFYSTNNGATWNALGAVSDANARLLAEDGSTRLYFQANADYHGTLANAITFRAWDQTSGINGGVAAVATGEADTVRDNFGIQSYSINNGTQSWSTNWIESETGGAGPTSGDIFVHASQQHLRITPAVVGDTIYREADLSGAISATLSFTYDAGTLNGSQRIDVQISGNGGASYTTIGSFTSADSSGTFNDDISSYIASNTRIRFYTAAVDSSGALRVDDMQIAYSSPGGGSTAFSADTDTASLTVNPVADIPSVTGATTNEDTQSTSGLVISRNVVDGGEVTHFKITGITDGTLYKNDGVTQITNGSFITFAEGNAGLKFTPDADFYGTGNFTIQASTTNDDSGLGGSTTVANVTVNPTSDAPVITGGPDSSSLTESDSGLTDSGTLTVSDVDREDIVTAAVDSVVVTGTGATSVPGTLTNAILQSFLTVSPTTILDGTEITDTLTWDFNSGTEAFDFLATGETLILTYTVSATDDDGTPLSDTETVTVTITGTNDAPVITGGPDTSALTETDSGLTDSGTLTVSDADLTDKVTAAVDSVVVTGTGATSVPGTLTNAILQSFLTVTPTAILDGTELTDTLTWDFNSGTEAFDFLATGETLILTYTVSATDDDGTPLSDTETVTVTITGTNDPTDIAPNHFLVNENVDTTSGYSVGTLASTDPDSSDTFTYSIVGGADAAAFSIGGAGSDELILTDGILDFETQPSYSVTVRVNDSGGNWYDETLTVDVNDLNEAPTVSLTNLVTNLAEDTDTTAAIRVADIVINDDALGTNHLTLSGADAALFEIVGNELRLKAGTSLDFETQASFDISVEVDDAGVGGTPDDSQAHTLNLDDVNETPTDIAPNSFAVDENTDTSSGFSLGTLTATDEDGGETFSYSIAGGVDAAVFSVGGAGSDELMITDGVLDFETKSSYSVIVRVTDSGGNTYDETLTVSVNDLNETPTDIAPNSFAVDENTDTSSGFSLGTLTATDEDGGETFTYSIKGGADAASFSIGGAGSDELILTDGVLDFETQSSYTVTCASPIRVATPTTKR